MTIEAAPNSADNTAPDKPSHENSSHEPYRKPEIEQPKEILGFCANVIYELPT
ncbi:MAG TPA: hypothetical protein PLP17_03835 [Oligoflexia bacterium]|nr:hypothetical protein [Oligoflexia bacterium]